MLRKKIIDTVGRFKISGWLTAIVVFYIAAVCYHFFRQGIVNWDEGYFAVVVRTYADILRTVFSHPKSVFDPAYYRELMAGYGNVYTAARPVYILAASFIGAVWPSIYATRVLSVISGAAILIYFWKILDFYELKKSVRFISVVFLAFSPMFLIYSRLGLSQIFSSALLLAALFYLFRYIKYSDNKNIKISAIFLSLLLMSHYNTMFLAGIIFLYSLYALYAKKSSRKDYLSYLFSFFIVPVIWQFITFAGVYLATAKNFILMDDGQKIYSYAGEFFEQLRRAGSGQGLIADQPLYYFKLLFSSEGAIFLILFSLGLVLLSKKRKKAEYGLIAALILFFIAIFSFTPLKFPRNIVVILPLFYLCVAVSLQYIYSSLREKIAKDNLRCLAMCGLFAAFLFLRFWAYADILNIRTNFSEGAGFISENYTQEELVIVSASAPIWRIYLPDYKIEAANEPEIWQKSATEGRKIVFINDYFTIIDEQDKFYNEYSKKLIWQRDTNISDIRQIMLDFFYKSEADTEKLLVNPEISKIKLYEL